MSWLSRIRMRRLRKLRKKQAVYDEHILQYNLYIKKMRRWKREDKKEMKEISQSLDPSDLILMDRS